ncbi:hypothetical protein BN132_1408 [Cronobacter turicensis 564]|nr:hypothetical protein BN132_1408 [Cronobacter turicensis 564]
MWRKTKENCRTGYCWRSPHRPANAFAMMAYCALTEAFYLFM